jgi:DNA-nicking Smr family endonuclease
VKKTYKATLKDKKEWLEFTEHLSDVYDKETSTTKSNENLGKFRKLDLHGSSLNEANKIVKDFIINSFNDGYKRLLIITGKGSRSKNRNNPYLSEKLSVLKHSVPEYIKNDKNLEDKVFQILKADQKDGGEGAINVILKKNKNLKE